jgi:hypothetical protein
MIKNAYMIAYEMQRETRLKPSLLSYNILLWRGRGERREEEGWLSNKFRATHQHLTQGEWKKR